ncbi:MAG: hypothetical protein WD045_12850 [Pirellulaceae bacterium]
MDGFRELLPYVSFIGGIVLLTWILMRRGTRQRAGIRKREGKQTGHLIRTPRPVEKRWTMSDGPADLRRWQVEMLEITRQLQGEINTKLRLLARWQDLARREADRLQALLEQAEKKSVPTDDRAHEYLRQLLAEIDKGDPAAPPPFTQVSEILCSEPRRDLIYDLADQQTPLDEIARQAETEQAVVEMILKLRDQS